MKIRVHFNRRAKDEKVWSIITSKACYHVKQVIFMIPASTEHKADSKKNPKAFIVSEGEVQIKNGVAYIL